MLMMMIINGAFQEKTIQFQSKVDAVKGKVIDKGHELINKWEEKSREFITNFLELFGKDGRIVSAVNSIHTYIYIYLL